jgi:hydroxymethylbilane synthase
MSMNTKPVPSEGASILRLGSRGSLLALTQSRQVAAALEAANPGLTVELEVIRTTGDRQQTWTETPAALGASGGKGIFVKEIEDALLERRVDAAVHSMKDKPTEIPEGLAIVCIPRREDPRDVLVAREGASFERLREGARIGTGSPRRISQLLHRRRDLEFVPIRGNVDTRMKKVSGGELDAVILAAAGLARLGIRDAGVLPLDPGLCLPAPGQGALAIESRSAGGPLLDALMKLHDSRTATRVAAERAFLGELGGGCLVPAAALAEFADDDPARLTLRALIADPDGRRLVRVELAGSPDDPGALGRAAALRLLADGGEEILSTVRGADGG